MVTSSQQARKRVNAFYQDLFYSDLIIHQSTMYDCNPDLPATQQEKGRLARVLALVSIDLEIGAYNTFWKRLFFARRIAELYAERSHIETKW